MDQRQNRVISLVKDFFAKLGLDAQKLILFGSYARGDYNDESDVDVLIVSERFEGEKMYKRGCSLYNKWYDNSDSDVDFICLTPKEFEEQKNKITIVREAVREGIVIV
jgi:uncharacterized protein